MLTLIECGGLVLVIGAGADDLLRIPSVLPDLVPPAPLDMAALAVWSGILGGAFLAFYAFIGFEDMVNVAEEVRDAPKTMPRGIMLTLAGTAVLYGLLSLVAVLVVPGEDLAASGAPLALIFDRAAGGGGEVIVIIGLLAALNGALVQIIMGSRVLYGLANAGWLPAALAAVDPHTRTPLRTTGLVCGLVLVLALWVPLVGLAEATSFVTLTVFTIVNLALWRIKRDTPAIPGVFALPRWVPAAGAAVSLGFLSLRLASLF